MLSRGRVGLPTLAPFAVAAFAGTVLSPFGMAPAALFAFVVLVASVWLVGAWNRRRLRQARQRLSALRAGRR